MGNGEWGVGNRKVIRNLQYPTGRPEVYAIPNSHSLLPIPTPHSPLPTPYSLLPVTSK
ncbi:MAG: hypothetical protein KME64_23335 [Scytonematopsis contorta HA4267-MV1]|nr:hypothetical protein [Scytonematopsis contorta HA4267-MV1]